MKIIEALRGKDPIFSFEFFRPKDAEGMMRLFDTIAQLRRLEPTYVSVTYGAGGSTRSLTVDLVRHIKREAGMEAMAHLTCVGATADELRAVVGELRAGDVENVLALRGDPPKGEARFTAVEGGFAHASDLVAFLRAEHGQGVCVAAAAYPEKHPEAPSAEADLSALARKVDAGVDFLVTQLFFDPADYFAFVERARAAGIAAPIVPGVMPVTNVKQLERFTAMCGASIPDALRAELYALSDMTDAAAVMDVGVRYAVSQCRTLLAGGAPGIHFYTLNRSPATSRVLEALR